MPRQIEWFAQESGKAELLKALIPKTYSCISDGLSKLPVLTSLTIENIQIAWRIFQIYLRTTVEYLKIKL